MTFKPLDVTAYIVTADSYLTGEFPRIEAQVRPLKEMTDFNVPGICIDIPGADGGPGIAVEVSVLDLLPTLTSMLPPERAELYQAGDPGPEYTEDEFEVAARSCGCAECLEYLSTCDCE